MHYSRLLEFEFGFEFEFEFEFESAPGILRQYRGMGKHTALALLNAEISIGQVKGLSTPRI